MAKKGGTARNDDREGLGWPTRELALLFILLRHRPTTILAFLRKAGDRKGRKRRQERKKNQALPTITLATKIQFERKGAKFQATLARKTEGHRRARGRWLNQKEGKQGTRSKASHVFAPFHILHCDATSFLSTRHNERQSSNQAETSHNLNLTTRKAEGPDETSA